MRGRIAGILVTLMLLAGSFAFFQFTEVDIRLQDRLYDFTRQKWTVDKNAAAPRLLFYTGPKVLIAVLGGTLLLASILPARWLPGWARLPWPGRRVGVMLACLAVVPITIGIMKAHSDIYCPWALDRYGGMEPYHHFFDPLPAGVKPDCGECFPAGHASGGFALMGLGLLFTRRRARWFGFAAGMTCGWIMGIYQMLKGAHFLSHTVTTMLLAILIIQIIAACFKLDATGSGPTGPRPKPAT